MVLAAGHGLQWCGTLADASWLGPFFSPCSFETLSSTLLLATTLLLLLAQGARMALVQQLRARGRLRKGISGLNGSYIAAAMFLCGTHLLHFAVGLVVLRGWPFHVVYHASLLLVWGTIAAIAIYTGRLTVSVDFRIATIPATLVYCVSLYSYFRLYFNTHAVPLPYIKASIWTDMLQAVVAAVISWLGTRRAAAGPSFAGLREQLGMLLSRDSTAAAAAADGLGTYQPLPAAEPAAGGSKPPPGGGDEDKNTWISLFVDACAYVWPESMWLQARAVACLLLLVAMRVLNLAVPILYKKVVDRLAAGSVSSGGGVPNQRGLGLDLGLGRLMGLGRRGSVEVGHAGAETEPESLGFGSLVWPWVVLYLGAVFFQGGAGGGVVGFINNLRSYLWIPVSQDSYRRISLRTFDHVMSLDLTFHLRKKTGEVTRVVDRGTTALQNLLATVLFNILPQMFDVLAAATYLAQALEPTIAIIVFLTVGSYIPLTIVITEWRGKLRREMNTTDQVKSGRATDALLNYETVKYFTNEKHESRQYAAAISAYQSAEYRSMSSINLLNVVQSAIMFAGIASGLLVCAGGVSARVLTVGDAVLFLSLMAQLYGPLNFFGSYYRTIQQYMIDMENLFELLGRRSAVQDSPAARELVVSKGELVLDHVFFRYEAGGPEVLRDVSVRVAGGRTLALVGATGSGKSTITRLLFRFYDVSSGAVRIDGQDVREVTQISLRRAVGMVPQDTVLFNDTILHNIRYGNLVATDEQVFAAAKLACIHDTIVNRFPKGYDTVVGERGLRLSGGEKQRVAFARALLKNPALLVLDEATSALDTITEKKIQSALVSLRTNRTTVIVAHRLSTVADADVIVVMGTGAVVEAGDHGELLEAGGLYAEMWARQAASAAAQGGEGSAGPSSLLGSAADLPRLASANIHHSDIHTATGATGLAATTAGVAADACATPTRGADLVAFDGDGGGRGGGMGVGQGASGAGATGTRASEPAALLPAPSPGVAQLGPAAAEEAKEVPAGTAGEDMAVPEAAATAAMTSEASATAATASTAVDVGGGAAASTSAASAGPGAAGGDTRAGGGGGGGGAGRGKSRKGRR